MTDFKNFIENYPLYKGLKVEKDTSTLIDLDGVTYNSICKNSNSIQTFELSIFPEFVKSTITKKMAEPNSNASAKTSSWLHDTLDYRNFRDANQHYIGTCKCCSIYKEQYIINLYSNRVIPQNGNFPYPDLFIKKIGQYPSFSITPSNEIKDFLSDTDYELYKKGLICLSQNYGIGAFSYFRRITENQIQSVCDKLIELQDNAPEDLIQAKQDYKMNHQMSSFISAISKYFPTSLKSLQENPLALLHNVQSIAIHKLSDDECYQNAKVIDTLLNFIFKKLNEEKTEMKDVNQAINHLSILKRS